MEREVSGFGPDLIHVMYGGVMAHQVTAARGLPPVIVTFHGSDLLGENRSGWVRKLISRYGVCCSRSAARRAQGVVVVARHLLRALGKQVDPAKIRVIPCGIDLERFRPLRQDQCQARLRWESNEFHILFASSAGDPVKRPELAQAAAANLERRKGRVRFHLLSGVPNCDVPFWINASDVLLLTSEHEGSPTIVKEALACGLPIVSVPVGDVPERIGDVPGCHLAPPDPVELAEKMALVYEHGQRLDCRHKLQALSCETIAARLEDFYREVLAGRARRPEVSRNSRLLSRTLRPA
jgi:glycosyltransferase involved in cell wall biosynthesis